MLKYIERCLEAYKKQPPQDSDLRHLMSLDLAKNLQITF